VTLLPSQPLGLRYIPCTCSIGEVVRPQMGEAMPAVTSICLSILSPPGSMMSYDERSLNPDREILLATVQMSSASR
jgi:hypothetical protein